jgi:hypothetical protein
MQYKCVPAPTGSVIDKKGSHDDAIRLLADFLNHEAVGGWQFHSMETFSVTQNPGCFAALILRQSPMTTTYYLAIFSKE